MEGVRVRIPSAPPRNTRSESLIESRWLTVRAKLSVGPGARDTKTNRSRWTLRIPQIAVEALQEQVRCQAEERSKAGELWQ